jgi:hypothetical protein
MSVNERIKPRGYLGGQSGTWKARLRFCSKDGWGEAGTDDVLRRICKLTLVQIAKMSITARPTRIPTMPRATL